MNIVILNVRIKSGMMLKMRVLCHGLDKEMAFLCTTMKFLEVAGSFPSWPLKIIWGANIP